MRREQTKQTFKLQLLALALALLLLWYSINPAPRLVICNKSEGELPDEKRRELEPKLQRGEALLGALETFGAMGVIAAALDNDEDAFEWPEFIDA
jgi:hypothetical protein